MDQIIEYFRMMGEKGADGSLVHRYGTAIQALGVTAGGLIGVFGTLALFYVLIVIANRVADRKPS